MRFVDEYRAPEQVMQLIEHLRERASHLSYTAERPLRIMEVCGGHTHAIFKFGLDQLLPENVEFIHGPGCPVCVLADGQNRHLRGDCQPSGSHLLYLWRRHARTEGNRVRCYRQRHAVPMCASFTRRWMR